MATLYFNGRPVNVPSGTTLQDLLKLQDRDPALVVVTIDNKFVPRSGYRHLALPDGASVKARELHDGG